MKGQYFLDDGTCSASQTVVVRVKRHLKGHGTVIYGSLQLAHLKELVQHCANLRRFLTAFAALPAQSRRDALVQGMQQRLQHPLRGQQDHMCTPHAVRLHSIWDSRAAI